jgi:hypothetical protein
MSIIGTSGTCLFCGGPFKFRITKQRTCSKRCSTELTRKEKRRLLPPRLQKGSPSPIRIDGDTAYVYLREAHEAAIDVADIHLVEGRRWRLLVGKLGHSYAISGYSINGDFTTMHRRLLGTPDDKFVDHKDGNGLNNRRDNIRNCTPAQNNANKMMARLSLVGASLDKRSGMYKSVIGHNGQMIQLGTFATKEEAAAAYQGASRVLKGEFSPWGVEDGQDQNNPTHS